MNNTYDRKEITSYDQIVKCRYSKRTLYVARCSRCDKAFEIESDRPPWSVTFNEGLCECGKRIKFNLPSMLDPIRYTINE